MAEWKCNKCGYTLKADKPPETCPSCKQKCEFLDVSCYILAHRHKEGYGLNEEGIDVHPLPKLPEDGN